MEGRDGTGWWGYRLLRQLRRCPLRPSSAVFFFIIINRFLAITSCTKDIVEIWRDF